MNSDRKIGYYWALLNDCWQVVYYDGDGDFLAPGISMTLSRVDFDEVEEERIER